MSRSPRDLAFPMMAAGICLLVLPFADAIVNTLPLRLDDATWRFGAAGLVSNSIFLPMVGAVMLVGGATLHQSRAALMFALALTAVIGLLVAVVTVGLALDTVQVRKDVAAPLLPAFKRAAVAAAFKNAVATVVLGLTGYSARRLLRLSRASRATATQAEGASR